MKRRQLLAGLGALPLLGADVPRPSPDFEVTMPDGRTVKLSSYKGKVLAFACILTT
ncbi:MAG: hypothetical protein JNL62_25570 [Bryobacterales bacterium]|nr:hypothetical protein [Bryobacterales bacterium]